MRAPLVIAAVLASAASLITATPASAAPPSPTHLSVAQSMVAPQRQGNGVKYFARLSWTNPDPNAAGVRVCVVQSNRAVRNPDAGCDMSADYPAPADHSENFQLQEGKAYSFSAFSYSDDSPPQFSAPATTTLHGTAIDVNHAAKYQTYGDRVLLEATLTDTKTDAPLRRAPLTLWKNWWQGGQGWKKVTAVETDAKGFASVKVKPTRRSSYEWRYRGSASELASTREIYIYLDYRVTAHLTSSHAGLDQSVQIYGTVRPRTADKRVLLTEYTSTCNAYRITGQRVTAKRQRLPNGQTTFGYVMTISRSTGGTHKFEGYVKTDDRLNGGTSNSVSLYVGSGAANRGMSRSAPGVPSC